MSVITRHFCLHDAFLSRGSAGAFRMPASQHPSLFVSIVKAKALADYDSGVTGGYLIKAEALLELAIECAQERRRDG
jgi:hypothetical protein